MLFVAGWLVLLVAHSGYPKQPDLGEILWPRTVLLCVGFIARGIFLGRPVTYGHAAWAGAAVLVAFGMHVLQFEGAGDALVVAARLILIQRAHNAGVITEIVDERGLGGALRTELQQELELSHGGRFEHGFSMILDGALRGRLSRYLAHDRP